MGVRLKTPPTNSPELNGQEKNKWKKPNKS